LVAGKVDPTSQAGRAYPVEHRTGDLCEEDRSPAATARAVLIRSAAVQRLSRSPAGLCGDGVQDVRVVVDGCHDDRGLGVWEGGAFAFLVHHRNPLIIHQGHWVARMRPARANATQLIGWVANAHEEDEMYHPFSRELAALHIADLRREAERATASALRERAHAAANTEHVAQTPLVQATLKTIEGEWSRVIGVSDPERWDEAAAAWDDLGCPYATAHATWRQSEALLAAGTSRAAVAPVLVRAWTTANGLGARLLADETSALARRARIEVPSFDASQPAASVLDKRDDFGLTAREREVLVLLGDGRTNREIGQALFISNKTVSVHVSNTLAKLNAATRGEAAALARRSGLD
jgi:DNA-binding CsgD family transcriptional regulator